MKKYLSAVCALALSAAMFTGCGCTNSKKKPEPTMMPTTEMTIAPTTHATTVPATVPTTEATVLPTETHNNSTSATEYTGHASNPTDNANARNRTPSNNS